MMMGMSETKIENSLGFFKVCTSAASGGGFDTLVFVETCELACRGWKR